MAHLQIRNVPDEVHRELKARAARAGLSLSELALRELVAALERPSLAELQERVAARGDAGLSVSPSAVLRASRDGR